MLLLLKIKKDVWNSFNRMGWIYGVLGNNGFIFDEKHDYFAHHKFNRRVIICCLWHSTANFLAYNYYQYFCNRNKWILFSKIFSKQIKKATKIQDSVFLFIIAS